MSKIRIRGLTRAATECIEDQYPDPSAPHNLTIGVTFIEGLPEDLLDAAQRIRDADVWMDWNGSNEAFYENAMRRIEEARTRWAERIERAVRIAQHQHP